VRSGHGAGCCSVAREGWSRECEGTERDVGGQAGQGDGAREPSRALGHGSGPWARASPGCVGTAPGHLTTSGWGNEPLCETGGSPGTSRAFDEEGIAT
jgi:hypothetical protein